MSQDRIVVRERGREYTVTGKEVGRALRYFTALSAFRTILGFIAFITAGAGATVQILKLL